MNLLTTNEAADRLKLHSNSIKRFCAKYGVKPTKIFNVNMYRAYEIEWIVAQRTPARKRQKYQTMLLFQYGKAEPEQLDKIIDVYARPEHVREWL